MRRSIVAGFGVAAAVVFGGGGYAVSDVVTSSPQVAPPIQPPPPGTPPAKAVYWNHAEQERIAAAGRPVVPPSTDAPVYTQHTHGIFADGQTPLPTYQFTGVNSWASTPDAEGIDTVVVAGGTPTNASDPFNGPHLAAVYVYTISETSPGPSRGAAIVAPAPDPSGEFTVTAANSAVLTLSLSGSSTVYYFNSATHTFQSAG
jgi:hypothetical protein